MSATLKELEEQALRLSEEERTRLLETLLVSLRDPPLADIETAWDREIERRAAVYDRGELKTFSAADVFAEARHLAR